MPPSTPRQLIDRIPAPRRLAMARELRTWFRTERDEEVGELAATLILDYVTTLIGPDLYNAALSDATQTFRTHADVVEGEIASFTQDVFEARDG